MTLLKKMSGNNVALPPQPPLRSVALAWGGGLFAMSVVGLAAAATGSALVLGSFGASCVLIFGFPDVPFSQPRNVLVGHFLSSLIGLVALHTFGPSWWAMGLAVGTACAAMMATRTVHPPAGSNPVIVFLSHAGWRFLLFPTLLGVLALVTVALLYNNLTRPARYPQYW